MRSAPARRRPGRICAARCGWAAAYCSAAAIGSFRGASVGTGCVADRGAGGSVMAMGAESDGARVISPTTRCSVCAARSAASASRSSLLRAACISSSSVRVLRACCIIAVDRAVHFRNAARSLRHARQPQAFHGAGLGSDIQGGKVGLVGVGGKQRGDMGDGGVVPAGGVLRRVGHRGRERGVERVDDLIAGVPGEARPELREQGRLVL
jgi:hypothetical protein